MSLFKLLITALFTATIACAAPPPTQPSPASPVDPALWAKMIEIDARAQHITSLSADFEQKKFTALLRKPLISGGRVRVKGATMRWDTQRPDPNVMVVTDKEFQLYYPAQKTVEIYPLDQKLAQLAASPLPRLAVLKDRFSFTQIPVAEMNAKVDAEKFLALKMTPT